MNSNFENNSNTQENDKKEKRLDYIHWDEYFMAMTFLELQRSIDKCKTDAAIILNQRKIIISMASSSTFNEESNIIDSLYDSHAEYKALQKIQEGHVIYTTSFPCVKCAESIIEAGIGEVIYYHDSVNSNKAKDLFDQCGVKYRQFFAKRKKIEIDFTQYCD